MIRKEDITRTATTVTVPVDADIVYIQSSDCIVTDESGQYGFYHIDKF